MVDCFLAALERLDEDAELDIPYLDFVIEWRQACLGLDLERLYLRVAADEPADADLAPSHR
jgi:hypothetical protein